MRTVILLACAALFVSACGYRGPLYMPDSKPHSARAATPAPASSDASQPGSAKP